MGSGQLRIHLHLHLHVGQLVVLVAALRNIEFLFVHLCVLFPGGFYPRGHEDVYDIKG